tara:strand:- start:126 stop:266 length:141 start_codon:yes stop_codon:yes gene_type:complete
MRIISKENKQVYTGVASAPNQDQLGKKNIQTAVTQASEEIFIDKAV